MAAYGRVLNEVNDWVEMYRHHTKVTEQTMRREMNNATLNTTDINRNNRIEIDTQDDLQH